jgi:hypothetical protein
MVEDVDDDGGVCVKCGVLRGRKKGGKVRQNCRHPAKPTQQTQLKSQLEWPKARNAIKKANTITVRWKSYNVTLDLLEGPTDPNPPEVSPAQHWPPIASILAVAEFSSFSTINQLITFFSILVACGAHSI